MLKPRKRLTRAKIKEDKFVTYTQKTQSFLHEHGIRIVIGAIAVVVVVVVSLVIGYNRASTESKSSFVGLLAREAYSRGDLDETLVYAKTILADYPGSKTAAVAMMLLGRVHEQRGELDDAIDAYKRLIDKYGNQEYLSFGAYYSLGSIYYGLGEFENAARYFSDGASRHPGHFNAPYSLFEAGRSYKKNRKYQKAKAAFRLVMSQYPKSRAVDKARRELEEIEFMP